MADSKVATTGPTSPPPNCAICLGTCTNKCYSDSCMHEFCFNCLLEWSKIKPECPLCKQAFRSIIHNIKSIDEYDEHIVENIRVEEIDPPFVYLPPVTPPPAHQYHFRTTLTVDTRGEHAIQQMLLSHPLITIGTFPPERYPHHRRRRSADTSTAFRRSIYAQNLWVYAPPDITGRYRDVTPSHYRRDPGARARLVPWLNRELNALLYENTQQVMQLVDIIMDHLLRHHICSRVFRTLLQDYLGNKTDHFIHEFYNFMRSPFDMIGYDRNAIYLDRPVLTPPPLHIDVSDDYDSDVIIVNSTTTTTNNNNNSSNNQQQQQQHTPIVIDLVDTDSDEPIIVSEEIPIVNNNHNNNNENSINSCSSSSCNSNRNIDNNNSKRKPILPLKIRIKNKRKSKEKKSRHHSKKRRKYIASSSTSSSSTSSSSTSSTSSSSSSSTSSSSLSSSTSSSDSSSEYECKRKMKTKNKCHRNSKLLKRTENRKNRRKNNKINDNDNHNNNGNSISNGNSDSEDELPLARMLDKHKYKYNKYRKLLREQYFNLDQNIIDRLNYSIGSNNENNTQIPQLVDAPSTSCQFNGSGGGNSTNNADDDCYDIKPKVKSEIKIQQPDDDDDRDDKSGPSTSNNNHQNKDLIEENLWYYRPHSYDQEDSSDG